MLREAFLTPLVPELRDRYTSLTYLDETLRAAVRAAADAYPSLHLEERAFVEMLAVHVNAGAISPEELEGLHFADLHLAAACVRGENAAIEAFQRAYAADVDVAISKSPRLGVSRDEFRQLVRTKLFVAEGGKPPRIASYAGRGALKGWVRVTTARLVVDLARAGGDELAVDDLEKQIPDAGADPETLYLRHAYGSLVPAAFADAVGRLSVRQRNLLRQRYLHGLGADRLAPVYGVHRATAFGWLEEARKALLAHVRDALARRVPGSELESVVGVLGSQLHVSVGRLLDPALEDEPKAR